MIAWFLLFDGSSPDGRGDGEFIGRTENSNKARQHYKKVSSNPHCTGYVQIVTDLQCVKADARTNWSAL